MQMEKIIINIPIPHNQIRWIQNYLMFRVCVVDLCCVSTHVCLVLCLFCLSTCMCVCLQVQVPLRECLRARRFRASLLLHLHLCAFLMQLHSVGLTLRSSPQTTFCILTTCEQAHYISPHELVASYMAGKSARNSQKSEATRPIPWYQDRASYAPLRSRWRCWWARRAVTHHCHHRPALPFRDWHPFTKPVLILTEDISSTFVPRGFAVLYPISRSGT